MKRALTLCAAAGFLACATLLLGLWLTTNRVEITISTEDQRTLATHYELDGMEDFAYHCQAHIKF